MSIELYLSLRAFCPISLAALLIWEHNKNLEITLELQINRVCDK